MLVEAIFENGKSLVLEEDKIKEYGLKPVEVIPFKEEFDMETKLWNKQHDNLVAALNSKFEHTYQGVQPELTKEMEDHLDKLVELEGKDLSWS